jgi:hypothetical protein
MKCKSPTSNYNTMPWHLCYRPPSMPQQNFKPPASDTIEKTVMSQRSHGGGGMDELMGLPLTGGQTDRFDTPAEERRTAPTADQFNLSTPDPRQAMMAANAEALKQVCEYCWCCMLYMCIINCGLWIWNSSPMSHFSDWHNTKWLTLNSLVLHSQKFSNRNENFLKF